jgi:hypothetical protein
VLCGYLIERFSHITCPGKDDAAATRAQGGHYGTGLVITIKNAGQAGIRVLFEGCGDKASPHHRLLPLMERFAREYWRQASGKPVRQWWLRLGRG